MKNINIRNRNIPTSKGNHQDELNNKWHQLTVEEIFSILKTSTEGITDAEAKKRIKTYGFNEIKFKKKSSIIRFLEQFNNIFIYVLLVAGLLCIFIGEWADASVILLVIIVGAIIGFIQEGKAEASIEVLKKLIVPTCTTIRDGQKKQILTKNLVPGDIVLIESGNHIPADMRLFYTKNLEIDESALTGESLPVRKTTISIQKDDAFLGERVCIAHCGTYVTNGSGSGIIINTGERTEMGRIAKLMKESKKIETPLIKQISKFTKTLMYIASILSAGCFMLMTTLNYPLMYAFLATIAFIVALVPELLPVIIVSILALASLVMASKKAIVRKLPAVETLGSVNVICSDKTGTLTKNEMTVVKIYANGITYNVTGNGYEPVGNFVIKEDVKEDVVVKEYVVDINDESKNYELIETLRGGYFCNTAFITKEKGMYKVIGDPTEGALVVSAHKAGILNRLPKLDEIPFSPEKKYMATLHRSVNTDNKNVVYVKGSPEIILHKCKYEMLNGQIVPINREKILKKTNEMAEEALRVIAVGFKNISIEKKGIEENDINELVFLGIQGMIDPPREEVINAIDECKNAGVRVVMVTGDHPKTAYAIAKKINIETKGILTGEDLDKMRDDGFYNSIENVSVYARISPEHKMRIVQQLQKKGNIVGVTGDGVNDAPALKTSDIGIAMGMSGTDVCREAADVVLADDNFATIVRAIEEGRHVWINFKKCVLYMLPTNFGQSAVILFAVILMPFIPLFTMRLPLEPIHILWVNLSGAIFLTLPLIMEPKEKNLLKEKPQNQNKKIADKLFYVWIGLIGMVMAIITFAVFYYFGNSVINSTNLSSLDSAILLTQAQTAALFAIKFVHIGVLITCRSLTESAFKINFFSNKYIFIGIFLTIVTLFMITYIPFLSALFKTHPFPLEWWFIIILTLFPGFIIIEVEKFLRRKKNWGY